MTRTVTEELIKPAKFAHFVLRCSDLKASVDWYQTVLGMETVYGNDFLVFLTYDDEHHRLALVQGRVGQELPSGAPGLDHVAYTLSSLGDLLTTYKRLKGEGILPVWPINHGLTTSLYYADPDGNRVEFQVENLATKEELNAYMHSDAFANNPIGVEFDPEVLLERYVTGDPLTELVKPGAAPKRATA
jgi:catechol-2,3-dioxygenase